MTDQAPQPDAIELDEIDADAVNVGGRPRKEINLDQLKAAVQIQCTAEECAALFDCCADTLDARLKEAGYKGFSEFYKIHSKTGKISLRRMQWKNAEAGNVAMQIWLGKQILGQRDKTALTGENGGPVETVDLSNLSAEELELYGRLAAKAAGQDADAGADDSDPTG